MSELKREIRSFIEQNFLLATGANLADADSLLQLQIVDSTGFMELVGFIETAYGVAVGDDELVPENLESIDNIARFIADRRAA